LVILGSPSRPFLLGHNHTSDVRLRPVCAYQLGTTTIYPPPHAHIHACALVQVCVCAGLPFTTPLIYSCTFWSIETQPPQGLFESKCANKSTCKYTGMHETTLKCLFAYANKFIHTYTHAQTYTIFACDIRKLRLYIYVG
jgi:hypothetical protein